jgi:predicted PurR-regulated permease PerM
MSRDSESDRFARVIFYVVVLLAGYLAFRVIRPFLQPLAWAVVFALLLQPVHAWVMRRRVKPGLSALATTLVAAIILVGPAVGLLSVLVREVSQLTAYVQQSGLITNTPARVAEVWALLRARAPLTLPEDPSALITEIVERGGGFLAAHAGSALQNVASFLFSLVVMLFALFFFLRDGPALAARIRSLLPFEQARRERLIAETHDLVVAGVGAALAVAAVQGFIGGVAFALLGFSVPALWGVAMAFCALLPVVGSWIVWAPAALWLLLSGDVTRGLILIGVGAGAIGMVDNVLRPIILSGRTTANGLVVFLGLLGGVAAFGFVGLVVGPVVLVTAGTLLETVAEPHRDAR